MMAYVRVRLEATITMIWKRVKGGNEGKWVGRINGVSCQAR
jgi:hypothetical protein